MSAKTSRNDPSQTRETHAATTIQRYYRGYTSRKRTKGMTMKREARWDDLVKFSGEKTYASGQLENRNDVKTRWRRAIQAANRIQRGDGLYHSPDKDMIPEQEIPELDAKTRRKRRATFWGSLTVAAAKERDEGEELPFQSKGLEQQHWLEMIDEKHRYGSNLKFYFRKWKEADTKDNFFRWLDLGGGKDLDLEEMPRATLEKELISYLSAEQRLNYLVKVDADGLLRWARNDELVDTARGRWKDAGNGQGIIPNEDPLSSNNASTSSLNSNSDISDSYSAISDPDEAVDARHNYEHRGDSWLKAKYKAITPGGIQKTMARKTMKGNTWIYVTDMKLNFFIGIKKRGIFQHSSFLTGGKVTSAGIIVVKHGVIKSLNPHSGHYRSSIEHYRAFIAQLENKGADLSHVKLCKSIMQIWGLTKYAEITRGEKDMVSKFKSAIGLSHKPTEAEKSAELEENAKREEEEHQARIKAMATSGGS